MLNDYGRIKFIVMKFLYYYSILSVSFARGVNVQIPVLWLQWIILPLFMRATLLSLNAYVTQGILIPIMLVVVCSLWSHISCIHSSSSIKQLWHQLQTWIDIECESISLWQVIIEDILLMPVTLCRNNTVFIKKARYTNLSYYSISFKLT